MRRSGAGHSIRTICIYNGKWQICDALPGYSRAMTQKRSWAREGLAEEAWRMGSQLLATIRRKDKQGDR